MKENKFSVPFNGINPDLYLELLNPYKKHIDHIYLGISSILRNHDDYKVMEHKSIKKEDGSTLKKDEYEENAFQLLLKTKGIYKTVLTLNTAHYLMPPTEIYDWCENILFPFIEFSGISGCICTSFDMAKYIHENMPHLELHTSCNCFQWSIKQMEYWQKHCGITVFNPPREILRSPRLLKEMHNAGFKIKALINESCLYGCPQTINHAMSNSVGPEIGSECSKGDPSNFFRSNWVLPRWLNFLDEYVDIYKINGRTAIDYQYIFRALDAYTKREDVDDLKKIVLGGTYNKIKRTMNDIPTKEIPDKLLTCECKECNKTCFICDELYKKFVKNNI
jgi:hypothetical protein